MADKEVKIKIATAGADQAAAEFQKVEKAVGSVNEATSAGFGGMLDHVPQKAEDAVGQLQDLSGELDRMIEKIESIGNETEEAADDLDEFGGSAEDSGKKLGELANLQRAQMVNELANGIAQLGDKFRQSARDFKEKSPEIAKSLDDVADGLDNASNALSGAAQGFALGGPFGSAVGALIGGALGPLRKAMDDMVTSTAAAEAAQQAAAKTAAEYARMTSDGAIAAREALEASEALTQQYASEAEAIKKGTDELRRRNEILDARDKLAAARGKLDDQQAVRNGAAPEDVKAARAIREAEAAKAKIDRDLELDQTRIQAEFDQNRTERTALDEKWKTPGLDVETLEKAEKDLKEREARNERERADYQTRADRSVIDKAAIDAGAMGEVGDFQDAKRKRLADEKRKADDKAANERRKAEALARRRQGFGLEDQRDAANTELDSRARSGGLSIRNRGLQSGNDTLAQIGRQLSDGTDSREIQKIGDLVKEKQRELGEVTVRTLEKFLGQLEHVAKRVENIEGQVKKARRDIK